jgi:hypothetical protein
MKDQNTFATAKQSEHQENQILGLDEVEATDPVAHLIPPGSRSVEADASRLGDRRLGRVQRQQMAARIGRLSGNKHLQRVIALTAPPQLQVGAPAVQREDDWGGSVEVTLVTPITSDSGYKYVLKVNPPGPISAEYGLDDFEIFLNGKPIGLESVEKRSYYLRLTTEAVGEKATVKDFTVKSTPGAGAEGEATGGEGEQETGPADPGSTGGSPPQEEFQPDTSGWENSEVYERLLTRVANKHMESHVKSKLKKIGEIHGVEGLELIDKYAQGLIGDPSASTPISQIRRAVTEYVDKVYKAKVGELPAGS